MTRAVLSTLLGVVALAAAVLSFSALAELAALCGFGALAPLLPLVVDAGAAAGSVAWLGGEGRPRAFGRVLALVLLAASVGGNAAAHGLAAYAVAAPWWGVVLVSAVPPAVLGAVVHLAGLGLRQRETAGAEGSPAPLLIVEDEVPALGIDWPQPPLSDDPGVPLPPRLVPREERAARLIADGAGRRRLARELRITEHEARQLIDAHRAGPGEETG